MATGPMRVGPYQLVAQIGQGGMGAVYKGRHLQLGVERAIKLLSRATTPQSTARFEREVRTLATAKHPALVSLHESGVEHGVPWFAMDLVPGEPLDKVLSRGPLPLRRAMEVTSEVARALDALHEVGVIHRDVKPQNILLRPEGHPVVIDLGLAVAPDRDERLTKTGAIVGTPQYLAPEQLGGEAPSPRTDVHALGLLLYELVVGQPAMAGAGSVHDVVARILGPGRPRLGDADPDVPAALDALCEAAMARDSSLRPARAGELADALDDLLRVPGPSVRARRRQRTTRVVLLVAALFAAAAVVALALRLRAQRQPRTIAPTAGLVVPPPPLTTSSPGTPGDEEEPSAPRGASLADRLAAAPDAARRGEIAVTSLDATGTAPRALVAGGRLVTWTADGKLASWSTDDLRAPTVERALELSVTDAAPVDGAVVLLAHRRGAPLVLRVDARTLASTEAPPRLTVTLEGLDPTLGGRGQGSQRGAVVALDPGLVVVATGGGLVALDAATLAPRAVLLDEGAHGRTVACAAAGRELLSVGGLEGGTELAAHGLVRSWPLEVLAAAIRAGPRGALPEAVSYSAPSAVVAVADSPTESFVAYATDQGAAFVVAVGGGAGMYTTHPLVAPGAEAAHAGAVVGLAFSADGRRLFSASATELRVWAPRAQQLLLERVGVGPKGALAHAPTGLGPGPSAELLLVGLDLWRLVEE